MFFLTPTTPSALPRQDTRLTGLDPRLERTQDWVPVNRWSTLHWPSACEFHNSMHQTMWLHLIKHITRSWQKLAFLTGETEMVRSRRERTNKRLQPWLDHLVIRLTRRSNGWRSNEDKLKQKKWRISFLFFILLLENTIRQKYKKANWSSGRKRWQIYSLFFHRYLYVSQFLLWWLLFTEQLVPKIIFAVSVF